MAFNPKPSNIGRRVRITKPLTTMAGTFTVGHEMTITGEGSRGYDLKDDDGNEAIETGMHRDHYEFVEKLDEDLKLQAKLLGVDPD